MPAERLPMRKVREVLRLFALKLSCRQIAESLRMARSTVAEYLRARQDSEAPLAVAPGSGRRGPREAPLRAQGGPPAEPAASRLAPRAHRATSQAHDPGAPVEEYKAQHPDGYQYSQFCQRYRRWAGTLGVWMRQEHRGGEKLFADYSGDGIPWTDPQSRRAPGRAGSSSPSSARATTPTPRPPARSSSTTGSTPRQGPGLLRAEFLGSSCPTRPARQSAISAATSRKRIRAYADFAQHYGTCIFPARPGRPKDKAKVEVGVLLAQRWIIAALRNRTFFSHRGDQRGHRRAPREAQRDDDAQARPLPRRSSSSRSTSPTSSRFRRLPYELADWKPEGPGEPRLPRRFREQLLQRPLPVRPPAGRRPRHRADRGDLPGPQARGEPRAAPRQAPVLYLQGAHAPRPPGARRVDAIADHQLGRDDRARHSEARRGDHGGAAAPRAGIPGLHGDPPTGQGILQRSTGEGLPPGPWPATATRTGRWRRS